MLKHYTQPCVIDESKCLPFTRWWSLPSSLLRLQFSFGWLLLAILPQQPLSENNHLRCVCQLFEKLTTISDCVYYSHPGLLGQLCLRSKRDCDILSLPVEMVLQSTELSGRLHTPGADLRLYLAALCYTVVTTSRLRLCFDRVKKSSCHSEIKLQD